MKHLELTKDQRLWKSKKNDSIEWFKKKSNFKKFFDSLKRIMGTY